MSSNVISFSYNQVRKQYRSRISYDQERTFLTILEGTGLVPRILESEDNVLTMNFVEGPTLLELLEKVWSGEAQPEEGRRLLSLLADWLCATGKHLFEKTGKMAALDDPHLRNFIYNEAGDFLTGLDFEHWHYGLPEETPAMLLAFLEGYRGTQSTEARELFDRFRVELITRLSLDPSVLSQLEEHCRRRILSRRSAAVQLKNSTAVILAGGNSRRMGCSKKDLDARGYTFLERTLNILDSFDHAVVSAREEACSVLTVPVWEDRQPGCGPIGGLLTALSRAETPLVFLTPCDTPDLTEDLILHLYEAFLPEDECLVPVTDGWIHPLTAIYRTGLLPRVEQLVRSKDHRILSLYDVARTHYLPLSAEFSAQLLNINTPLEYEAWLARQTTAAGSRQLPFNNSNKKGMVII